jgi:hypothetical protein
MPARKRGGDLFLVEVFLDGDAARGGRGREAVRPQGLEAEATDLRDLAAGEDSLAEHQRHDAIEAEQGAGARHVGDRLGETEVSRVHDLEQARRHRRIHRDDVGDVFHVRGRALEALDQALVGRRQRG